MVKNTVFLFGPPLLQCYVQGLVLAFSIHWGDGLETNPTRLWGSYCTWNNFSWFYRSSACVAPGPFPSSGSCHLLSLPLGLTLSARAGQTSPREDRTSAWLGHRWGVRQSKPKAQNLVGSANFTAPWETARLAAGRPRWEPRTGDPPPSTTDQHNEKATFVFLLPDCTGCSG